MEQTHIVKFFNEVQKIVGIEYAQKKMGSTIGHVISVTSALGLGYFAFQKGNHFLLGAGFVAGLFLSHFDVTCGKINSLQEKALLPMSLKGNFALQKVALFAIPFIKHIDLPAGFFAGNALYHYVSTAISGQ